MYIYGHCPSVVGGCWFHNICKLSKLLWPNLKVVQTKESMKIHQLFWCFPGNGTQAWNQNSKGWYFMGKCMRAWSSPIPFQLGLLYISKKIWYILINYEPPFLQKIVDVMCLFIPSFLQSTVIYKCLVYIST